MHTQKSSLTLTEASRNQASFSSTKQRYLILVRKTVWFRVAAFQERLQGSNINKHGSRGPHEDLAEAREAHKSPDETTSYLGRTGNISNRACSPDANSSKVTMQRGCRDCGHVFWHSDLEMERMWPFLSPPQCVGLSQTLSAAALWREVTLVAYCTLAGHIHRRNIQVFF